MDEVAARSALSLAMAELVSASMGWTSEKGYRWMMAKNPHLGDAAPADLVMRGRSHKVLAFIENRLEESKPAPATTEKDNQG